MNGIDTFDKDDDNKNEKDKKEGEEKMALPLNAVNTRTDDEWVTTGKATKMLGVSSVNTVKRWVKEGKLEAQKFDDAGWMRISVNSIHRLLQSSDENVKAFQRLKGKFNSMSDLDVEVTKDDLSQMSDQSMGTLPWRK